MTMDKEKLMKEGLEQLAEKQAEEMDNMLARRFDLPQSTHSADQARAVAFSELFSDLEGLEEQGNLSERPGEGNNG
jgi:hypothetical protein